MKTARSTVSLSSSSSSARPTRLFRGALLAAIAGTGLLAACSDEGDGGRAAVSGAGSNTIITSSGQALMVNGSTAAFQAINGTYGAACILRSGSWSTPIGGYAGALANPALSVVQNDPHCTLTLESVVVNGQTFAPGASFPLSGSYAATPMTFSTNTSPFYANAKLTPADFSTAFTVDLFVSDDVGLVGGSVTATYSSVASSGTAAMNPAPDYTLDTIGVSVSADGNNVVQTVSGSLALTVGSIAGAAYVTYTGSLDPTNSAAVKAAYQAGSETAITGSSFAVAASSLGLTPGSTVLPQTRYVIIRGTQNAVTTYEVVAATFKAPVGWTYSWQTGSFGSCSVSCGGGTQTRTVSCGRSDGATVSDSFCSGAKPSASQSCNTTACAGGSCAGHCGGYGGSCYCDGICQAMGDCCSDYVAVCQ